MPLLSENLAAAERDDAPPWLRRAGLLGGPALACALLAWAHPQAGNGLGLGAPAAWTLALLALMCIWWMTTAVDMAVTALLPVVLLPLMGVGTVKECAAPYADEIIFLFAGGSALGLALDRNGVSARFAGGVVRLASTNPVAIVCALFVAAACVSAWVSNTATAAMMLPVALSVTRWAERASQPTELRERALRNFGVVALLAVAYGASVGGLTTLIGSPPNAIAAQWLDANGSPTDFVRWMTFAGPVAAVFGPLVMLVLIMQNPLKGLVLRARTDGPGPEHQRQPISAAGWVTLGVFAAAVVAWIGVPFVPGIPKDTVKDGSIAVAAAVLLFTLPGSVRPWAPTLPAQALRDLPWGVLILFGGGMSLAAGMERSGLSAAIGHSFTGLSSLPAPIVVGIVVASLVFASEIASNTALTATAVPIVGALAPALNMPAEMLVIPAACGASYAFMLPVGTPPNALVYATGKVPLQRMLKAGFVLDIIAAFVITAMACFLLSSSAPPVP